MISADEAVYEALGQFVENGADQVALEDEAGEDTGLKAKVQAAQALLDKMDATLVALAPG